MVYKSSFTILFENPFWIGLYERVRDGTYEVCKITFGAEPKDYEVYSFLLQNWNKLRFTLPIKTEKIEKRKINPKRLQRQISSQLEDRGMGTKAQQVLQLQREQNKAAKRIKTKEQKEIERKQQYALRQEKKKAKHKGR